MSNSNHELDERITDLIRQEGLPDSFRDTVYTHYLPLTRDILVQQQSLGRTLMVGVNGAQGTGKSTLALFIQQLLNLQGCPCASFSLDDLYLTKAERIRLAEQVHPLFITRGVPGTHDLTLGNRTLDALASAGDDSVVAIPTFNKAEDDRADPAQWPRHVGPAHVILVEGWCVAATAEADESVLLAPINELEQLEDEDCVWRKHVNLALQREYLSFFARMDRLIMLKAPSMECILEWRTLQEQKLAERLGLHYYGAESGGSEESKDMHAQNAPVGKAIMSPEQIKRFIMHYERLTRAMLDTLPAKADTVFLMNSRHQITGVVHNAL